MTNWDDKGIPKIFEALRFEVTAYISDIQRVRNLFLDKTLHFIVTCFFMSVVAVTWANIALQGVGFEASN